MSILRHLEGTAYIVYGPGPGLESDSEPSSDPGAESIRHGGRQQPLDRHDHHSHDDSQESTGVHHFWAVFRPDSRDERISLSSQNRVQDPQNEEEHDKQKRSRRRYYVLRGTPYPWGSYPSDLSPPHGCIPPHLYYRVIVSEHECDNREEEEEEEPSSPALPASQPSSPSSQLLFPPLQSAHSHSNVRNNCKEDHQNLISVSIMRTKFGKEFISKTWLLPYVHRFGDGKDDAAGLTSAYALLEDLEDAADDYGAFMDQELERLSEKATPKNGTGTEAEAQAGADADVVQLPLFYACTQVLISEQRTIDVIEQHVFSTHGGSNGTEQTLPKVLNDLRSHISNHTSSSSQPLPFFVLKSDLKLILPQ